MTATETPTQATSALPGRLLRLELRRNAMLWMLPLLIVLFWALTYRDTMALPALWSTRVGSFQHDHGLPAFVPFAAGAAAWMGSRDGRRGTTELVATTPRSRWTSLLTTWAATTLWALLTYLACIAVLYGVTAEQVTWGSPPLWPVAVGAAAVVAFCALGFGAGAVLSGWFTAPLAAVVTFLLLAVGQVALHRNSTYAQLSLISLQRYWPPDSGNFYHYFPDLAIDQIMLLGGLAVAALAGLGLPRSSGGAWLRRTAAVLMLAGLAAAGNACYLAGTAQVTTEGVVIPDLHDAANDQPIRYTPVCDRSAAIPVCLQPAYRGYLPDLTTALEPILSQVAELPGAPASVVQSAAYVSGPLGSKGPQPGSSASRLDIPLGSYQREQLSTSELISQLQVNAAMDIVVTLIEPQEGNVPGLAQQAVAAAIFTRAGVTQFPEAPQPGTAAYNAAQRFAALPAVTRHQWLATHLTALRSGRLTLAELP